MDVDSKAGRSQILCCLIQSCQQDDRFRSSVGVAIRYAREMHPSQCPDSSVPGTDISCKMAGDLRKKVAPVLSIWEEKTGAERTRLGEAGFEGFPLRG